MPLVQKVNYEYLNMTNNRKLKLETIIKYIMAFKENKHMNIQIKNGLISNKGNQID